MNKKEFVAELSKLRPSSTFLSVMGYRNEYSEIADYSIAFHINYENACQRSLEIMKQYSPISAMETQARLELINSFNRSIAHAKSIPEDEIEDAYTRFFNADGDYIKGVKMHTKSENIHLYGLLVHKKVIMPGMYPVGETRKEFTVIKDKLRRMTPVGKFRQFRILPSQVDRISVEHLSLLPPV